MTDSIFKEKEKNNTNNEKGRIDSFIEQLNEHYKRSLEHNMSFVEHLGLILKDFGVKEGENEKITEFSDITGISVSTINRLIKGKQKRDGVEKDYFPLMRTVITLCKALKYDVLMTETLLESLGFKFDKTRKLHYTYCFILSNCQELDIDDCNILLKMIGAKRNELLGEGIKTI